jgi:hypothetical protein
VVGAVQAKVWKSSKKPFSQGGAAILAMLELQRFEEGLGGGWGINEGLAFYKTLSEHLRAIPLRKSAPSFARALSMPSKRSYRRPTWRPTTPTSPTSTAWCLANFARHLTSLIHFSLLQPLHSHTSISGQAGDRTANGHKEITPRQSLVISRATTPASSVMAVRSINFFSPRVRSTLFK